MTVRQPAVAGMFYEGNSSVLHSDVLRYLSDAEKRNSSRNKGLQPKALVLPHAGHIYSGPVAASGYTLLKEFAANIKRVVLLGPSHRVALRGVALPSQDSFATPLGDVALDTEMIKQLDNLPFAGYTDLAHEQEHSLEVHLPFLQETLPDFKLVPLVVGASRPEEVAKLLDAVWGGDETLVLVSSDLSHFHDYDAANDIDSRTARKILDFQTDIDGEEACGCNPLNGLLYLAKEKTMRCEMIDLRNSGDTAGDRGRVVGYGTFAFYPHL